MLSGWPLITPSSHMAFLSNFTLDWPQLTPARPLTPSMHCIVLSTKFGCHRAFLRNMTSGWPWLTPAWPLTPAVSNTFIRGSSYQIWWPYGISKQFWPLVDPDWPLHELWPQQYITLWSGVLPTKFDGHRAFLSNLTPGWPQMTSAWHLIPAVHYALVRGSFHQIW